MMNGKGGVDELPVAVSRYDWCYYCSRCGKWIPKQECRLNERGLPVCPYCGNRVRTKPRR